MRAAVLTLHVLAGTLGLLLGPFSLAMPEHGGWAARFALAYQWGVAVLAGTAVALAVLRPSVWWLGVVAVLTEAAALAAWRVRRRRRAGWRGRHLRLVGGSYIALLTALVVVSVGSPLAWLLPAAVGTPLVERAAAKHRSPSPGALASA